MKGRDLRGRVDSFGDMLTDVEAFFEEQGVPDAKDLIEKGRAFLDSLFYRIPLEGEEEQE